MGAIALHPAQRRVIDSIRRFVCAVAGARGGKTYVGARTFCRRVKRDLDRYLAAGKRWRPAKTGTPEPALRYWVVAPTFDLCVIAQQELSQLFEAYGWRPRWTGKQGRIFTRCWLGNRGVLIEFKSADRPHALVSVPLDGLWIDEAARLKPEAWLGNLRQRLSDRMGWALFTTTPLGPNWLFSEVFQRGAANDSRWHDPTKQDEDYESVHWTTADNPHPGVQADLAVLKRTLPKRYYDREALASFDAYRGQVYDIGPEHIAEWTGGRFDRVFGGVDFGHGAPGAIEIIGVRNGRGGARYHIADERYAERLGTSEWTQAAWGLVTANNAKDLYADPAGAQQIRDWSDAGLPMRTHRRINDVKAGIRVIATLLKSRTPDGAPRLTISPKCRDLIREIKAYRYREDSAGNALDEVVKENDHACDASRYGIFADHLLHDALRSAA